MGARVLIVSTNRCRAPMPVMPVGACMVAESAERAGHAVRLLDLMFERRPLDALARELACHPPDVVGLSVRNIDNNDMRRPVAFSRELTGVMETIRRLTGAPVVLGGSAVGIMPGALLGRTGAEWAALGDGRVVFPPLVDALARGGDPRRVPGAAWLEGGRLERTPAPASPSPGCRPAPRFSRWLDTRSYASMLCSVPLQTKRGCPFDCVYCTYAMNEGKEYVLGGPDEVAEAAADYAARGVRDIEFVDNVFNAPRGHAMALCERLARKRLPVRFQTMELNPRFVDDALFTAMERAGFSGVGISADSASDEVLAALRKGFSAGEVGRAAEVAGRHRLPCFWMFLLGGPGETRETVRETLAFAGGRISRRDVVCFTVGIRVYPGTALEERARAEGALRAGPDEMLDPVFYLAPGLDPEWVLGEVRRAVSAHANYMSPEAYSIRWLPWLYRAAWAAGTRPPIWRHTRTIRRALRWFGRDV